MEINVIIDESFTGCPGSEWFQAVIGRVLSAQKTGPDVELGLVITNPEQIRELNRRYRRIDRPTDVLAFAMADGEESEVEPTRFVTPPDDVQHLGEVIISYPQAVRQAQEQAHTAEMELAILVVHGVLHLFGYDHADPEPERLMKAREAEILGTLEGIINSEPPR
ncbi:MAG: rRNA maturation RNase YbeY [Dehalococcoidales bacterium]